MHFPRYVFLNPWNEEIYPYLSCSYFSRQKIGLSSTKVGISCLQKNSLYLIFIIVPYPLQKALPKLLLSLTHFTTTAVQRFFAMNANKSTFAQVQTFMTKHGVRAVNWWRVLSTQFLGSRVFVRFIQNKTLPADAAAMFVWCTVTELPVHQIYARTNS